jgi:hypothetical protein
MNETEVKLKLKFSIHKLFFSITCADWKDPFWYFEDEVAIYYHSFATGWVHTKDGVAGILFIFGPLYFLVAWSREAK